MIQLQSTPRSAWQSGESSHDDRQHSPSTVVPPQVQAQIKLPRLVVPALAAVDILPPWATQRTAQACLTKLTLRSPVRLCSWSRPQTGISICI
jgi:hypothetical protein